MMEVDFDCVSTADDAALSTTSCKYPHSTADDAALKGSFQDLKVVTLEFVNERVIIDTDVLPTKESWEKLMTLMIPYTYNLPIQVLVRKMSITPFI